MGQDCPDDATLFVSAGVAAQVLFMNSRFMGFKEDSRALTATAATDHLQFADLFQESGVVGFKQLDYGIAFVFAQVSVGRSDEEWEIGLLKKAMKKGTIKKDVAVKQNLMGRYATANEVIDRMNKNVKKEAI